MFYKFLFLFLCFEINLIAQQFNVKIIPDTGNKSIYGVIIKIKADSAIKSALGNATLRFNYDNQKLFFPHHPVKGKDFNFEGVDSKKYLCSVTSPTLNTISINIFYERGKPILISDSLYELVRIYFKKQSNGSYYKLEHFKPEFFSPSSPIAWDIKVDF